MPSALLPEDCLRGFGRCAQARLAQTRESYLRVNGGRLWGRPINGIESRYLLTGLSSSASVDADPRGHETR